MKDNKISNIPTGNRRNQLYGTLTFHYRSAEKAFIRKKRQDTHPLNQTGTLHFLQKDYPHLSDKITGKKVRWAVEKMAAHESALPDLCKTLRFHKKHTVRPCLKNKNCTNKELVQK